MLSGDRRLRRRSGIRGTVAILVLSQVGALAISFALTPYQLHTMGSERYGILAITASLLSYLAFVDVGVGWALTHFVPYYRAAGEEDSLRQMVFAASVVSIAIGLPAFLCLWAAAPWISGNLLDLTDDTVGSATFSIRAAACGLPIVLITSVLAGIGRGLGLFAHNAVIRFLTFASLNIAWALFAASDRAVEIVSLSQLVFGLLALISWALLIRSRFPEGLTLRTYDRVVYRALLSYGVFSSVTNFGNLLLNAGDKLLLAVLVPVQELVFYSIPFTLASQIPLVSVTVALVLFPRFSTAAGNAQSAMASTDDSGALANAARGTLALFNGTIVVGAVLAGPTILRLWLGAEFADRGGIPLQALSIGFGLMALGSVDQVFLQAHGRVRTSAAVFLTCGVSGILALGFLAPRYGVVGASIAMSAALGLVGVGNVLVASLVRRERLLTGIGGMARIWLGVAVGIAVLTVAVKVILLLPVTIAIPVLALLTTGLGFATVKVCLRRVRQRQRELAVSVQPPRSP